MGTDERPRGQKMAQGLREHATLPEDLNPIPSTHVGQLPRDPMSEASAGATFAYTTTPQQIQIIKIKYLTERDRSQLRRWAQEKASGLYTHKQ